MIPNWLIVGAPKAGTSSLFQWLCDHPEVCGSAEKETYFFVDPGTHMHRPDRDFAGAGLTGYERLFERCRPDARVVVEATPSYMYSTTALRELPRLPTRPQFVFLLREPVAQVRSLHGYFQQNWDWIPRSMSFAEFVEAARAGSHPFGGNELAADALLNADYAPWLRRWAQACGPDRLHVLLFEDLAADPRGVMRRLASRMDIDAGFYDSYGFPRENETYAVRSGALQSINIRVRQLIPHGRLYELLRRLYRAANTTPAAGSKVPSAADREAERRLTEEFLPGLDALEREFGLDLTSWRRAMEARLSAGDAAGTRVSDGTGAHAG